MTAVSSMRVRAAHGNSFDHLVGAGEQRGRHLDAERVRSRHRLDGKVPQAIVGDVDHPSVTGFREWLEWMRAPGLREVYGARLEQLEGPKEQQALPAPELKGAEGDLPSGPVQNPKSA